MRKFIFFLAFIIFSVNTSLAQSSDNIYDWKGYPSDGLTRVEYKGKFGYINDKNSEVIAVQYIKAQAFRDGMAQVSLNGKDFGYINRSGKIVIPLKYEQFSSWFSDGLIPARLDGKWGMVNEDGKTIIPHLYSYLSPLYEGLAVASLEKNGDTKYGYLDAKGRVAIPFEYEKALGFNEGLACVRKNNKYGFINKKGDLAIPFQYNNADVFSEGLAMVRINGKWGYIDKRNTLVIPAIYSKVYSFSNNEAEVMRDGEGFRINKKGRRLSPGQWLMIYTKGQKLGKQYWNKSAKVPGDELYKKYKEGYRLTDYVYDQHNNEIFVTMSNGNTYSQNGISYNNTPERLWTKLKEYYVDGYNTTHVTYGNGKWSWNATKLPRQKSETRIAQSYFPLNDVEKGYKQGKFITSLGYGKDQWIVIMRNENYSDQQIKTYEFDSWNKEDVESWLRKGYAITDLAKDGSTYTVIYTKGTGIREQLLVWEEEIPVREISKYWGKGYALYKTFYIPRWITIGSGLF